MRRERLCDCILEGDAEKALIETERLLAEGTPPEALVESLAAEMETLGERFQNYDAFLPDLILGACLRNSERPWFFGSRLKGACSFRTP